MPGGQPPKQAWSNYNLSGLKNHPKLSPSPSHSSSHSASRYQASSPNGDDCDESDLEADDEDLALLIHFDFLRMSFKYKRETEDE